MIENYKNIDDFYRNSLSSIEEKPSGRFSFKIHLLFLYLRSRLLILLLLVLIASGVSVYFVSGIFSQSEKTNAFENNNPIVEIRNETKKKNKSTKILTNNEIINNTSLNANQNQSHDIGSIRRLNSKPWKQETVRETIIGLSSYQQFNREISSISQIRHKYIYNINSERIIPDCFSPENTNDGNKYYKNKTEKSFNENVDPKMIMKDSDNEKKLFSLSLYVAPLVSKAKISASNNYNEYLELRKESETAALSWSIGSDIEFNWNSWIVKTGINYSVYRNQKKYDYNFLVIDSANSYYEYDTMWVWIYDPPNLEYPVMVGIDTNWIPVYNNVNVVDNGINEWSYLEIPLLVGYNFDVNKFRFKLLTGVSVGFLIESKGKLPYPKDIRLFEDFDNMENEINKTMYNWIFQAGFTYQINNNWSVFVQPYYKQNIRSVFSSSYPVKQRFISVGLNCGVSVRL